MSNFPSNPISVNQITDTNLNLKCIPPNDCRDLTSDIQAFIDDYCSGKFDSTKIIQSCLTGLPPTYDINFLLNKIITKFCNPAAVVNGPEADQTQLLALNFCTADTWTTASSDCLTIVDSCNNPVVNFNEVDVFRSLIRRVIALEGIIRTLKTTIDTQQVTINNQTSEIANIIANCCNISLLSSIQTINNRLAAAGIP